MRETRLSGSEGGGVHALPTPIPSYHLTPTSGVGNKARFATETSYI